MSAAYAQEQRQPQDPFIGEGIWDRPEGLIECRAILRPEEEGGFSAIVRDLPGAVSQGDTEAEALANLREAFAGLVLAYRENNQPIPFCDREAALTGEGCKERWILVHV